MKMLILAIIVIAGASLFRYGWKHHKKATKAIVKYTAAIVATAYVLSLVAYYTNQGSIV